MHADRTPFSTVTDVFDAGVDSACLEVQCHFIPQLVEINVQRTVCDDITRENNVGLVQAQRIVLWPEDIGHDLTGVHVLENCFPGKRFVFLSASQHGFDDAPYQRLRELVATSVDLFDVAAG